MNARPRLLPSALFATLALTLASCGPSALVTSPVTTIAGSTTTSLGELEYVCTVAPSSHLPGEIPLGGCMRTESLRLGGFGTPMTAGMRNELCASELVTCRARSARLHTREDAGVVLAVVDASGQSELHAVYVSGGVRAFRWKSEPKSSTNADDLLASMPPQAQAIDDRLHLRVRRPSSSSDDHLWDLVQTPAAIRAHAAGVAASVERCEIAPEAIPPMVGELGDAGVQALFASTQRLDCPKARAFLRERHPPGLEATLREALGRTTLGGSGVAARFELAAAYGPTLAPALDEALRRTRAELAPNVHASLRTLWLEGIEHLARADKDRAAALLLDELRALPPSTDDDRSPLDAPLAGELAHLPSCLGGRLEKLDSPIVRAELAAIARDAARSPGARKVSLTLLSAWGDPAAGSISGVAPSGLQRASIEFRRAQKRPGSGP
jgi:hypothetical protein